MKKQPKVVKLPVSYSIDSFDSERFLKLRVKVMHTGLNLNNSNFNMDAINAAADTIANIPLLAFIKKTDGEDSDDFAGHEYEIKITENDVKYVYLGRPIGIVPETNNYAIETDEDGKSFVVVDAYVWKDYANSALDILNRDAVKKVSMEILVDDYEYNESYIDIKAYKYTGVALLGEDVREAMIGAQAEIVQFSEDSTLSTMMAELKAELMAFSADENNEPEETDPEDFTDDNANDENNTDDENNEDFTEENENADNDDDDENFEAEEGDLEDEDQPEEFTEDDEEQDTPPADPVGEIDYEAKIKELEKEIEDYQVEITNLKEENAQLAEYKNKNEAEKFAAAKVELLAQFDDLEEEEIQPLKDADYSLDELEMRLFALRGKKATVQKGSVKSVVDTEFTPKKPIREPEYADLVRQYKKK